MATATAKKPKKAERQPISPYMTIPVELDDLSDENRSIVEAYAADCQNHADDVAELHAARRILLGEAGGRTIDQVVEDGARLAANRARLQDVGTRLMWRRLDVLRQVDSDVRHAAELAQQEYDRELKAERECLASQGINPSCMPAGKVGGNAYAEERQFEHFLKTRDVMLAMQGVLNEKLAQARNIKGLQGFVVNEAMPAIAWELLANPRDRLVAKLAGVASDD